MSAALRALAVAAIIVLLAYAALWAPKLSRIAELRAEREQLTEQYGVKMNLAINLDLYRQQLRDLDAMFGQLLEALPDRPDRTFAAIAAAVRRHDVQLQVMQGDEKEALAEFHVRQGVHLEASGRFHQVAALITDLVQLPASVRVDRMSIERSPTGGRVALKAELGVFRYPLDEESAAVRKAARQPAATR